MTTALSLGLVAMSCTGGATPPRTSAPVTREMAVAAVRNFDPADSASLGQLNRVAASRADVVPALAPFLEDDDPIRRWAAVYAVAWLTDSPAEADQLLVALEDGDVANRVIAAGSLSGLGYVESLPVLIEGFGSDELLPYHDPPRQVAELAQEALEAYTGQTFADVADWRGWWDAVKGSIRWDVNRYVAG